MRRKFFLKSFINIFSLMMLPICILGLVLPIVVNNYIRTEFSRTNNSLLDKTQQISQMMFGSFNAVNIVLSTDYRMITSLRKIMDGSRSFDNTDLMKVSELTNFVNSFIATSPLIESVYVYIQNDSGRFYSSSHGISKLSDFQDKSWFDLIEELDIHSNITNERMVKRYAFESDEKEIISVYRKLLTNDGVVILNIDAEKLKAAVSEFDYQDQQSIIITDSKGKFNLYNENDYISDEFVQTILSQSQSDFIYTWENEDYVVSKRPLNQNDWFFISVIPRDNLYKLQDGLFRAIVMAILVCLVIGTFMSVRVVRKNYKNINDIIRAIEAAESGEFFEDLPSRNDEYNYIIRNIIQNGILKRYLEVQLSEKKLTMKNLELTTLQCQINPHFLVNTLKNIYWKSVSVDGMGGALPQMIENLSDVVGYSLTDPMMLVSMETEINHTQSFIDILKERHSGEFIVVWDYREDVRDIMTEKIIIQPLIENAVYHGIRPSNKKGAIKIKIYRKDSFVYIKVIDNGVGVSKNLLGKIRESLQTSTILTEHIGLANTHKRIQLKFGENYGLHIRSKENLGTSVSVCFPYISAD